MQNLVLNPFIYGRKEKKNRYLLIWTRCGLDMTNSTTYIVDKSFVRLEKC